MCKNKGKILQSRRNTAGAFNYWLPLLLLYVNSLDAPALSSILVRWL